MVVCQVVQVEVVLPEDQVNKLEDQVQPIKVFPVETLQVQEIQQELVVAELVRLVQIQVLMVILMAELV